MPARQHAGLIPDRTRLAGLRRRGARLTFAVRLVAIAVLAIVLSSCGDDPASQASGPALPPSQVDALADGVVEAHELERAVFAMMTCLDDRGIPHTDPVLNSSGYVPLWDYEIGPISEQDNVRLSAEADDCWAKELREVQDQWTAQYGPTAEEQLRREQVVVDCANERGIPVGDFQAFMEVRPSLSQTDQLTANKCMILGMNGQNLF